MQYVIAIGIFQALMVCAIFWKNKVRAGADLLLLLLVLSIAFHLGLKFVIYNFINDLHVRHQMNTFTGYCYGPLLYLYALKVSNKHFSTASKWYYFLPFFIGALAYFTIAGVLFISNFSDYRLLQWYNDLSTVTMLASQLCFGLLTLQVSKKRISKEKQAEKILMQRLAWCYLLMTLAALTLLSMSYFMSGTLYETVNGIVFRSIVYASNTAICMLIGYYTIFREKDTVALVIAEKTVDKQLTKKAVLDPERQKAIWDILEQHLKLHQTFTDSELSLDKLAVATGINKYHISETLNGYAQRSFYQYINEYRIQYAIDRMTKLHQQEIPVNVLSLAYDAGFKAKSSFNRYFKEITGFTPTEHLRSLN